MRRSRELRRAQVQKQRADTQWIKKRLRPGPARHGIAGRRLRAGRVSPCRVSCRVEPPRLCETHWKSIVIDAARRNMKLAAFRAREARKPFRNKWLGAPELSAKIRKGAPLCVEEKLGEMVPDSSRSLRRIVGLKLVWRFPTARRHKCPGLTGSAPGAAANCSSTIGARDDEWPRKAWDDELVYPASA